LAAIARRDAEHVWMRIAIQSSLASGAAELLTELVGDNKFCSTEHGASLLRTLARQIGMRNDDGEIALLATSIESLSTQGRNDLADAIALSAVDGASKAAAGSGPTGAILKHPVISLSVARATSQARTAALDLGADESARLRAIEALAIAPFEENREAFARLMAAGQPHAVQVAAVTVVARMRSEAGAQLLLEAWPNLTPRLRAIALDGLTATRGAAGRLLAAIDAGAVTRGEIEPTHVQQLLRHRDETIRQRAKDLFRAAYDRNRDEIVRRYQKALMLEGSTEKGRAVFRKVCAACHRAEGEGHELGPNLAAAQNRGADAILLNILDPNREVNPQYVNYVAVTKGGQSAVGMITGESATSIVLSRGEGISETILRSEIEELTSTGLSQMPEGFESQIDVQSMADLLAYLTTLK
jgi:putative heme-binding domain-containing protein